MLYSFIGMCCILFNLQTLIVLSRAENEADSKAIEQQSFLFSNCFFPIFKPSPDSSQAFC